MDEESTLARLPEGYAAALRLRRQGLDDAAIAERLGLEREAVGPLLQVAEAKLAALREPIDEPDSAKR
jgi:DNA-directed RNA polymerase specialized sigma24 family protein